MQIWGCKVYQGVPHVKMRGAAWKPPTYRWVQRSELEHSLNMTLFEWYGLFESRAPQNPTVSISSSPFILFKWPWTVGSPCHAMKVGHLRNVLNLCCGSSLLWWWIMMCIYIYIYVCVCFCWKWGMICSSDHLIGKMLEKWQKILIKYQFGGVLFSDKPT